MNCKRNNHKSKDDDLIIRIPNGCPQLVDNDTFNLAQERILLNRQPSGMYNAKHRYMLSGVLKCGYCGRNLSGNRRYSGRSKSLSVTYRCITHRDSCISKEYNLFFLEDFILAKIEEYFGYKNKVTSILTTVKNIKKRLQMWELKHLYLIKILNILIFLLKTYMVYKKLQKMMPTLPTAWIILILYLI